MNSFGHLLSSDDIVVGLDVAGKRQALEEAALLVGCRHEINHAPIFRALWRREEIGSTAIGHGIAIPHARIAGISEPILFLALTRHPIKFGALDRQPVSVLFVILVPEHANDEHLQILAIVSEMFADQDFRDQLNAATEATEVQRLFGEWDRGNR